MFLVSPVVGEMRSMGRKGTKHLGPKLDVDLAYRSADDDSATGRQRHFAGT